MQKDGKEERRRRKQDGEDWTHLGEGLEFQGESFPREQGTPPLLFHTPVLVAKPGASLQRLLGGGPCPFYKLRDGHLHAFTPLLSSPCLSSPLGKASKNTVDFTEYCNAKSQRICPGESRTKKNPGFLAPTQETFLAASI